MKYIVFAIAIIIIWQIKRIFDRNIDENERIAYQTPGTAHFIRTKYPNLIKKLLSVPRFTKIFERDDTIKIGTSDKSEFFHISNYSGGIIIAYLQNRKVLKEWKFSRNEQEEHIIYSLKKFL